MHGVHGAHVMFVAGAHVVEINVPGNTQSVPHDMHGAGPPVLLNVPTEHVVQTASVVGDCAAVWYAPTPHTDAGMHNWLPTSAFHVRAGQGTHVADESP